MKDEVNAEQHGFHPSAFILSFTPSLTVGLPPQTMNSPASRISLT
jgi:hypothetical protein